VNSSEKFGAASPAPGRSRNRLLNAALRVIRTKGYASTTVDDICHEAGVTKGSFFHHFKTKDDLALGAIAHWRAMTESFFASAPYHRPTDPVARLLGYLDFRANILTGDLQDYTCLLGTLVQETYETHPHIRIACELALSSHVAALAADVEAAKLLYATGATWTADSIAYYIQSVLQGSFIFAKAKQGPEIIGENIEHLRRYLQFLFPASIKANSPEEEDEDDHRQSHFVD
jgi:TetR/AcrR family transcriptional repressor of nem operon